MTSREQRLKRLALLDERKMIARYDKESSLKGSIQLTPEEVQAYINAKGKTKYLESIGKAIK